MTTPSGPISIEITEIDLPVVSVVKANPHNITISSSGPQGETGPAGPDNLVIVVEGTPLPTDPDELAELEGKLWIEYTP